MLFISSCAKEDEDDGDPRTKFEGSWTCVENSTQNGTSTYTINITKMKDPVSQISIVNFYNVGVNFSLKADVDNSNFTIAPQTFVSGKSAYGTGAASGSNNFTMTYYVTSGSIVDTCTATCTR